MTQNKIRFYQVILTLGSSDLTAAAHSCAGTKKQDFLNRSCMYVCSKGGEYTLTTSQKGGFLIGLFNVIIFFNAINFCDHSSFQNHPSFLVPLLIFCRKFIHPAKFGVAFFASHVSYNMSASEHHSILSFTRNQRNH